MQLGLGLNRSLLFPINFYGLSMQGQLFLVKKYQKIKIIIAVLIN